MRSAAVPIRVARLASVSAVALFAGAASCPQGGSPPVPSSPPTFVLAWNASGGSIRTMESLDALTWRFETAHATTTTTTAGPAVAHDGRATWMVMWPHGPELRYKVGIGGATVSTGIVWEQSVNVSRLVVLPSGSPALAFGAGRWVVVFRRSNGQLGVARSAAGSATSWETAVDLVHQDVTPRPAVTSRAPALAFGSVGGRPLFVVSYVDGNLRAVAATSSDGVTWSPASPIGVCEKDPALSIRDGMVFALLSRLVSATSAAAGFHEFASKSSDAVNWTPIGERPGGAQNATGPAVAYGDCRLVVTQQIGGALGGPFVGIASTLGLASANACADPPALAFTSEAPVRPDGQTSIVSAGNSGARTALAFGVGPDPAIGVRAAALTQSGLVDRPRPPGPLVAGKTTLLRVRLLARSGGQPSTVDRARLAVVARATSREVASVDGFALQNDTTRAATLEDGADVHFLVPGASLTDGLDARFDIHLTRGSATTSVLGVEDHVLFQANTGVPLVTVSFDQGPGAAAVAPELAELTRIYPIADPVGALGSGIANGARSDHVSGLPLPEAGSGRGYENEFVLSNLSVGSGPNAAGVNCAADVPRQLRPGRFFATNFTFPEDLDRDGTFSPDEVSRCQGNPTPMSRRFDNLVARLKSDTIDRRSRAATRVPSDPPKFGVAALSGTQNPPGLGGQCPQGLSADRACWITIGLGYPILQHELGHALGLDHNDASPVPPGPAYDLRAGRRISSPNLVMRGNVSMPMGGSFLLASEFDRLQTTLRSSAYLNLP